MSSTAAWLGAWILTIMGIIALSQSTWGKTLVYYFLWLAVLLLVVTHANDINTLLASSGLVPASGLGDPTGGAK